MIKKPIKNQAKKPLPAATVQSSKEPSYSAKDIYVLEGLEPVRKRPGMYIGSTGVDGLHHLIWEVVDNSIDEAMAGYAKNIRVELLKNNKVAVADDGRGIPVEIHAQTKKSALETVMTTLHAGGKFGGESYKVSGGLHGVGVSVVNALSKWMRVEVCRDGQLYSQEYEIGNPKYKVKKENKCQKNGTKVIFEPDQRIFAKIEFDLKKVLDHLRQQAYLTKGVRIELIDERDNQPFYYSFYFEGGLLSFVKYLEADRPIVHDNIFYVHKTYENIEVETAAVYREDLETQEMTFANNIYTPDGGMHLTGFRSAITRTLNDYAWKEGYLKQKDENLTGDDVREGLTVIISVKIREPQFEGQTKARLGNPEARTAVESVINEALKEFLEKHSADARKIIEKCLLAAKARKAAKAAKETVLRKGALEGMTLPGKLADCSSRDPEESELFIVEGDSAGGCFSGDTKVALTDGRNLSFKELTEENAQGKKNYCYTIGLGGYIKIEEIIDPRLTIRNTPVIKVVLDNNEEIICTPNHKFMLSDGTFKEAQFLEKNNSLMPLYRQYSKLGKRITIEGYEMVFDPGQSRWIFTHLLSDQYNIKKEVYFEKSGAYRHHLDFNKLNNNPNNLIRLNSKEHLEIHRRSAYQTLQRPDVLKKLQLLRKTPEYRKKISETMLKPKMRHLLSTRAKKQWQNQEYKFYMLNKFLDFYKNNLNYRQFNKEMLYQAQKKYWSEESNRQRQAECVKAYFKKHPNKLLEFFQKAKKQWQNEELKKWRSIKTKEQWTNEFRIKRFKAYNLTYRQKALAILRGLYESIGNINIQEYERIRRQTNDKNLLKYGTILQRFFENSEQNLLEAVKNYNHKIKAVIKLQKKIDVYDLEVSETHNFALASGIFVHNSAKQGRDRRTQAILPLKGKILNVEKARIDKMLLNKEIRSLVVALGTAIADEFDIERLRYHKIILMTDADVDGSHIRTLLLTLFYRYFPKIIENGNLYIAQPPLYRIQKNKEIFYVYSDNEKERVLKKFDTAGANIQRYKGLGEMNPDQLSDTTMNQETRMLKKVEVGNAAEADRLFDVLMGENVEPRKNFIQSRAEAVKNLDV
ncbi:MAG: DNA topoisomerase (ATP-hydrolyzing) subunit B [Patescibacteria group bacterium]